MTFENICFQKHIWIFDLRIFLKSFPVNSLHIDRFP